MSSIIFAPGSSQTVKVAIAALLASSKASGVTGVYRDLARVPAEFKSNPKFKAIQGDVADSSSLDFSGHDVVVTISPPQDTDTINRARKAAENVHDAAKRANVSRVVYLSSVEAEFEEGTGQILTNRVSEKALETSAPEVTFIRAAYFMENLAANIPHLQGDKPTVTSTISPADYKIPMVSVKDIGNELAEQAVATHPSPGAPHIFELHGPWTSSNDVRDTFAQILGKKVNLNIIEPENLSGFFGMFMAKDKAELFAEMTKSYLPGEIAESSPDHPRPVPVKKGNDTLLDALKRMLA